MADHAETTPTEPSITTQLAYERTKLAHDRTAWVRTAASLISFGFTMCRFFQFESGGRRALYYQLENKVQALVNYEMALNIPLVQ